MQSHAYSYPHYPIQSHAFIHPQSPSLRRPLRPAYPSCYTIPSSSLKQHGSLRLQCQAVLASDEREVENAKFSLLKAVRETERGLLSSPDQRALIEESMIAVETLDAGSPLDLAKLDGTWMLQYTTASDVLSILQAAQLPILKVGQIFQKFECSSNLDGGLVRNVVRWSLPGVLQDVDGATLTVTAKFHLASSRNIALQFEEAAVGSIMMSEELQALIAPAILPRTFFSLEVLQFIRGFNARFPLRTPSNTGRIPLGLLYYISFVDKDMLLGRALGSGGIFIFTRTQPLQTL